MQRKHEVDEVEAQEELEAVRGHGEGQRGEVKPHGLAHQDREEEKRLQRGQHQPHYQVVRPPRLSEMEWWFLLSRKKYDLHQASNAEQTGCNEASDVDEDLLGIFENLECGETVDVCEWAEVIGGEDHDEVDEAVAELDEGNESGRHGEADHTQTRVRLTHVFTSHGSDYNWGVSI